MPKIRRWFAGAGFDEVHFESPGANSFSVGLHRSRVSPQPLPAGERLFTFIR